jgi:hypothetical protein
MEHSTQSASPRTYGEEAVQTTDDVAGAQPRTCAVAPRVLSNAPEQHRPPKSRPPVVWSLWRSKCLFNRRYSLRTNFTIYV